MNDPDQGVRDLARAALNRQRALSGLSVGSALMGETRRYRLRVFLANCAQYSQRGLETPVFSAFDSPLRNVTCSHTHSFQAFMGRSCGPRSAAATATFAAALKRVA